jgi:hypothetical protein
MKKAILKTLLFFAVIAIVDLSLGKIFDIMQANVKGGSSGKLNYIAYKADAQIVVFGSSRGDQHYVPHILKDSLDMTCYNASRNGTGIILMYGRYKMLSKRYQPKLIIYDVEPGFDFCQNDNSRYITWLKPFYNITGIDSIIWNIDSHERVKMLSHLYRYNYRFLELLSDYMHPYVDSYDDGHSVQRDTMKYVVSINKERPAPVVIDPLKMYYLNRLITDCQRNGTKLVFVASPRFGAIYDDNLRPMARLCKEKHVPFLDYTLDKRFDNDPDYWHDSVHMNEAGAIAFDKTIIPILKKIINA